MLTHRRYAPSLEANNAVGVVPKGYRAEIRYSAFLSSRDAADFPHQGSGHSKQYPAFKSGLELRPGRPRVPKTLSPRRPLPLHPEAFGLRQTFRFALRCHPNFGKR